MAGNASVPTLRAGTSSASMLPSHSRQSGHHDPLCSCAPLSQSARVMSQIWSLVQNWYFPDSGGLTTPAICPEPDSTYFTGPPKNCEPYSTDSAGAMWSSGVAGLWTGTFTLGGLGGGWSGQ